MRVLTDKLFKTLSAGIAAASLAACGGGGGADATVEDGSGVNVDGSDPVSITVTADKTSLPLNVAGVGLTKCNSSTGELVTEPKDAWGTPYMTTIYVQAKTASGKVLTGTDLFQWSIVSGFNSGKLAFFDGDHTDRTVDCTDSAGDTTSYTVENTYRFGNLSASANAGTMHLLATDVVGTIVVRFGVVDEQTNKLVTKDLSINVGGATSGLPVWAIQTSAIPGYIYTQNSGYQTVGQGEITLYDETGLPVSDPVAGTHNVKVSIDPMSTANGAYLKTADQAGQNVVVATTGGVARFSVVSGATPGVVRLTFSADSSDNNVDNGIQSEVSNVGWTAVVSPGSISILSDSSVLNDATVGSAYVGVLSATGGVPPYTFSPATGSTLPIGLSLTDDGAITGVPTTAGTYSFSVIVSDSVGSTASSSFSLTVQ